MADDPSKLDTTPPEPSPFIRTMAKDVARLTGQPVPVTKGKKDAPQPGVVLPSVDESPIAYKDAIPQEFKSEVVQTSKDDDKEVFAEKQKGASFFSSIPHVPVAVTPSVPQPTEEERTKILERLRAQAPQPAPPVPPAAPLPQEPVPAPGIPPVSKDPYRQPLPSPEENVYRPVPPPSKAPIPAPLPSPPMQEVQAPDALHTYKTDFADHMDKQKATNFSVLAAAGDAGQTTARPTVSKRSLLPIVGGVVLVCAGVVSAAGALWFLATRPQVALVPDVPSLVIPDETIELTGSGSEMYAKLVSLSEEASVDGNVYVAYISTSTPTQKGIEKTPLPGGYLIAQLPLHAPTILLRNLDTKSTAGLIDTGPETRAFFILRVTSYERSFAGMLAWESTIRDDLRALYPEFIEPSSSATTTASTTPTKKPVVITPTPPPRFVDEVVANHDVRALKDSKNRTILLYGYRDKATLIIARDEDAFSALITRLTATPQ